MAYALPVAFCTVWIVLCHSFCFVDFAKNKCFFFFFFFFFLWVCYHDNSKLRASILGEGSDRLQLIKFWPSCAPGRGGCGGNFCIRLTSHRGLFASKGVCGGAKPYYSQRAVFASLWALFHFWLDCWKIIKLGQQKPKISRK